MRTRLTFIGTWSYVDDNGVGLDSEKLITAALYPLEDDPREALANVTEDLATLQNHGRIVRYTVNGKRYFAVTNWGEHQRIDKPGKARYPGPDQADAPLLPAETPESSEESPAIPETLATVSRDPIAWSKEQGTGNREEGTGKVSEAPPSDVVPYRPDVERVCEHLADRIAANGSKRPTVTKAWRDAARLLIDKDEHSEESILRAIDWCQGNEFWRSNILSMPKLREQYDRLRLQAQRGNEPTNGHRPSTTTQRVNAARDIAEKFRQRERAAAQLLEAS